MAKLMTNVKKKKKRNRGESYFNHLVEVMRTQLSLFGLDKAVNYLFSDF
jgi:hypothetical protein